MKLEKVKSLDGSSRHSRVAVCRVFQRPSSWTSLDGTAPLSLSLGRFHLKLYAGFILNIPILGHSSHQAVTDACQQMWFWSHPKWPNWRKKVHSDVVQIPFQANQPLCQHVMFRSGRISGTADVKWDGHLHSSTNRDLFDTVISVEIKSHSIQRGLV